MDKKRKLLRTVSATCVLLLMLGTLLSFFFAPCIADVRTRKELGLPEDAFVTDTARSPWIYITEEGGIRLYGEHMDGMETLVIPSAVNGILVTNFDHSAVLPREANIRTIVFPKSFDPRIGDQTYWFASWESLEVIAFEEGTTDLSKLAIYEMPALRELYLPRSMTGMYAWSLKTCGENVTVYYAGTEEEWWALGDFAKTTSGKYPVVFETPVPTFEAK